MPRLMKVLGLVLLGGMFILIVSVPGAKPQPAIPLNATFLPSLESTTLGAPPLTCKMLNDIPVPYASTKEKTFGNSVEFVAGPNQTGRLNMIINKNNAAGRFIDIDFSGSYTQKEPTEPLSDCAPNPYFLADKRLSVLEANTFRFKTMWKYTETWENGNRILTNNMTIFNFATMTAGTSAIVTTVFDFYVADDTGTFEYNESSDLYSLSYQYPARVFCGDFDSDTKLEWVITPVQEPFYDRLEGDKLYPFGTLFRGVYSNYYKHCQYAEFFFPFKLMLDPK